MGLMAQATATSVIMAPANNNTAGKYMAGLLGVLRTPGLLARIVPTLKVAS